MTKEEKGKTYALHKASEKLHDYYGSAMLGVVQFNGYDIQRAYVDGYLQAEQNLEVKEVDLEKELNDLIEKEKAFVTDNREVKYYNGDSFNHIYELEFIAKHFFELGLKINKGE
jgi:hypothetical protein